MHDGKLASFELLIQNLEEQRKLERRFKVRGEVLMNQEDYNKNILNFERMRDESTHIHISFLIRLQGCRFIRE